MNYNKSAQAKQILLEARRYICQQYPLFMDAIYQLQLEEFPQLPEMLSTDGVRLLYHPDLLLEYREKENLEGVVYHILHICFHCLLGHIQFRSQTKFPQLFDALADYKVKRMLNSFCVLLPEPSHLPPLDPYLSLHYADYPLPLMYEKLQKEPKLARDYLESALMFYGDNHSVWNMKTMEVDTSDLFVWKNLMEELQTKADSNQYFIFCYDQSITKGGGCWSPKEIDVRFQDYHEILSQFLRKSLVETSSILSIDPMWYHYGLEHFGDIPMIEPGEEDFAPTKGTLIIAIDTSGSCQGELCDRFLAEINSMMEQLQAMDHLEQVVLLQCDMEIQDEVVMSNVGEWNEMLADFTLIGGGGTDFTPVYQRGEAYQDVVGLIYLSDGYGTFPQIPSSFPSLFLLTDPPDTHLFTDMIPSWVQVAYLDNVTETLQCQAFPF